MALKDQGFAKRLRGLCDDYYYKEMDTPPIPVRSMERINSILGGMRKPTVEELIALSEAYDVSINYLLTGDEMFPSLHRLKKKDAKKSVKRSTAFCMRPKAGNRYLVGLWNR